MTFLIKTLALAATLSIMGTAYAADPSKHTKQPLDEKTETVVVKHFENNGKDYFLRFVTHQSTQSNKEVDEDVITLKVTFTEGKKTLWAINDKVTCYGVDISGEFIPEATTFNAIKPHNGDIDNIEVTVGYKMFCGGGVDPKTLKIIYHDNTKKVALRGETAIAYEGDDKTKPIGGQYKMDNDFKKAPLSIQNHLKSIWKKVYIERY